MRWERLFGDLEAHAEALASMQRGVDIADRSRIETSRLRLADRLAGSDGADLQLRLAGGTSVSGQLRHSAPDWLLVTDASGAECLVFMAHVLSVSGLGRWSGPAGGGESSAAGRNLHGVGQLLRALSVDRSTVTVHLLDGSAVSGTVDRVGADFLDVAVRDLGEFDDVVRRCPVGAMVVRRAAVSMIRRRR